MYTLIAGWIKNMEKYYIARHLALYSGFKPSKFARKFTIVRFNWTSRRGLEISYSKGTATNNHAAQHLSGYDGKVGTHKDFQESVFIVGGGGQVRVART